MSNPMDYELDEKSARALVERYVFEGITADERIELLQKAVAWHLENLGFDASVEVQEQKPN